LRKGHGRGAPLFGRDTSKLTTTISSQPSRAGCG
jgi:hypothetical protein